MRHEHCLHDINRTQFILDPITSFLLRRALQLSLPSLSPSSSTVLLRILVNYMPIPLRDLFTPPSARTATIPSLVPLVSVLSRRRSPRGSELKVTRHRRIRFFRLGEPEKRRRERISFDERLFLRILRVFRSFDFVFSSLLKSVERGDDKTGPAWWTTQRGHPPCFRALCLSLSICLSLSLFAC